MRSSWWYYQSTHPCQRQASRKPVVLEDEAARLYDGQLLPTGHAYMSESTKSHRAAHEDHAVFNPQCHKPTGAYQTSTLGLPGTK